MPQIPGNRVPEDLRVYVFQSWIGITNTSSLTSLCHNLIDHHQTELLAFVITKNKILFIGSNLEGEIKYFEYFRFY